MSLRNLKLRTLLFHKIVGGNKSGVQNSKFTEQSYDNVTSNWFEDN